MSSLTTPPPLQDEVEPAAAEAAEELVEIGKNPLFNCSREYALLSRIRETLMSLSYFIDDISIINNRELRKSPFA